MLIANKTQQVYEEGSAKAVITLNHTENRLEVKLDLPVMKSIQDITDVISVLNEVRDGIRDDIRSEKETS